MTAVPDWNDPDMRRRLCTALCELLHQYGKSVVLPDGCVGGHSPDLVNCELGVDWP